MTYTPSSFNALPPDLHDRLAKEYNWTAMADATYERLAQGTEFEVPLLQRKGDEQ